MASQKHLEKQVVRTLRNVFDPEIPVDIYELGLVYGVDLEDGGKVTVTMTLTSPGCPVAESLPVEVERRVASLEGVTSATVKLVWEPPWTPDRMSEAARLTLGM